MKSYGVAIQMKPLQQYFHMVLYIEYVVLTFESVDEIPWCYHSNETSLSELSHSAIYLECSSKFFESGDEILWCYHSDETFWAELLSGVISVFPTLLEYLLRFIDRPFCD